MTGPVLDGKRYSPFDPSEVHADMRADPETTWRNVARQPLVLEKHRDCEVCASVRPQQQRLVTSRRARLEFTTPDLADRLGLPTGTRIVRMSVVDDPLLLCMIVEGADLAEVPDDQPTPPARLTAIEIWPARLTVRPALTEAVALRALHDGNLTVGWAAESEVVPLALWESSGNS